MRLERLEISEWEALLPDSEFGVFHTSEGIRVLDKHAPVNCTCLLDSRDRNRWDFFRRLSTRS